MECHATAKRAEKRSDFFTPDRRTKVPQPRSESCVDCHRREMQTKIEGATTIATAKCSYCHNLPLLAERARTGHSASATKPLLQEACRDSDSRSRPSSKTSAGSREAVSLRYVIVLAFVCFAAGTFAQSPPAAKNYNRFTHRSHLGVVKIPGTNATRELKCDDCHERAARLSKLVPTTARNERLRLEFPGHRACIECHVVQFTSRPLETCTICHERTGTLTKRPPQRDFPARHDFNVFFDGKQHEAHVGYTFGDNRKLDCAFCHKPSQRQVARLVPDHSECYACHTPQSGIEKGAQKSSCSVCHTQMVEQVAERKYTSLAYGARFTHKTHVEYVNGDCRACHTLSGGFGTPLPAPGTIRIKQHLRERERSGKGCFSCHDGGQHYGRQVFSGEYGPTGSGSCVKCHGDNLRVFPASGGM